MSLVPSATETLLAWGVVPVGVTRFCEQPSLVQVGGTKDPDLAAIAAMAPDLVVLCEEENRREDATALVEAGLAIHVVRIDSLDEVHPALVELADAVEVDRPPPWTGPGSARSAPDPDPGPGSTRTAHRPEPGVRAFVPIWRRPWMTLAGRTYGSSVLEALGVANVFAEAAERYPTTTLAEAAERGPDLVVAPSEPYPFGPRHVPELESAVAPVVLVDGQDLFWWGVRTPAALGRLSDQLAGHLPAGDGAGRSVDGFS